MEAVFYERNTDGSIVCHLCPHECQIPLNHRGWCRTRLNDHGLLRAVTYGMCTSAALDPIEKKPFAHFHPGSRILSIGSMGCNMCCPFCQNWEISQAEPAFRRMTPKDVLDLAISTRKEGNIGVAYTYNEPLLSYEFIRDTAPLIKEAGMVNAMVTNGCVNEEPLTALLPLIDAWNIDLKTWDPELYRSWGGDLPTVKRTIVRASEVSHVEITCLIIPGVNDDPEAFEDLSVWLASVSPDLPLHITRFFPRLRMQDLPPTPVDTLVRLGNIARKSLRHVNIGNTETLKLLRRGWINES